MLFEWNDRTMTWHLDASDYTGYAKNMAALLLEKISGRGSLCDIGCGMALVDFELAPSFQSITCVDLNRNALEFVRRRKELLGTENLTVVHCDGAQLQGSWDTVIALFHGEIESKCENYLRKAAHQLVVVTHGTQIGTTGPDAYHNVRCDHTDVFSLWLNAHGYTYERFDGALNFGQPHRSFEDAVASTSIYCPTAPMNEIRENVRRTALETGRTDFPLFTPKTRRFSVFVIPKAENQQLL